MDSFFEIEKIFLVASDNHLVVEIDALKLLTAKEIMNFLSEELRFPSYFSNNLNSFEECLNDLDWLDEKKIVLMIKNSDFLLNKEKPEIKEAMLDIFFEWNKNYEKSFLLVDSDLRQRCSGQESNLRKERKGAFREDAERPENKASR